MSILWITEQYFPSTGGMAQSCDRIVYGLRQQGLSIDVVHLTRKSRRRDGGNSKTGYDYHWPLGDTPAHELHLLWGWLEQQVEQGQQYSKIVAYGMNYALLGARNYSAWLALPLLTFVRGNDFDIGIFDPRRRMLLQEVYQHSETVFCVSRDKAAKITALFPEVNAVSIANGICQETWRASPRHHEQAQSIKAQYSPAKKMLGLFGDIKDKKGGRFFLQTLSQSEHRHAFHILIVGEVKPELLEWLDAPDMDIDYTLQPMQERFSLIPYYLACDAMAIPSFYDGAPNVMLEAAALARPILASDTGGMKDMLNHLHNALLFNPGDKHGLQECLGLMATMQSEQLAQYGERAKQLVAQDWNGKAFQDTFLSHHFQSLKF